MDCLCGGRTVVLESRRLRSGVRRRRQCQECGARFTSMEKMIMEGENVGSRPTRLVPGKSKRQERVNAKTKT